MAYIFQTIADLGVSEGITPNKTQNARNWYRNAAQSISTVNKKRLMNDKQNVVDKLDIKSIGKMYMFFYDPKLKKQLPYYDTFPLVFPIGFNEGGFLGINLHYLSPNFRSSLMNKLYDTTNNTKYDDSTKLKISYNILNSASQFSYFKPCVKRYLWNHVVGGQYLYVEPKYWDTALLLPTERFEKASNQKVFKESAKAI